MRNRVILVDEQDRELGIMTKEEAHQAPHLHRAFSVFLYHDDQMLIQQRALHKYHSGGLWANTCCSHPSPGEPTLEAGESRLMEEAGIECRLKEIFSFEYCHQFAEDLYEHEYDHVLVGCYNGGYRINPEEIAQMRWISFEQLSREMERQPQHFAPWFLIAAPRVMQLLQQA